MELQNSRKPRRWVGVVVVGILMSLLHTNESIGQGVYKSWNEAQKSPFSQTDSFDLKGFVASQNRASLIPNSIVSTDKRVLKWVYSLDQPLVVTWLAATDKMAYPLLFGTPVATWILHLSGSGVSKRDAIRVSGAWLGSAAGALVLKRLILKERPYVNMDGVDAKIRYRGARGLDARASMPSGHSAISFALATAFSLQHPEWYIVGSTALVASSVAVSRVWLGVHYPSDVLSGALLGAGSAFIVHLLVNQD